MQILGLTSRLSPGHALKGSGVAQAERGRLTGSVFAFPRENLPSRFKFKEYCPMVFRNLRERFGIDDQDYQVRSCLGAVGGFRDEGVRKPCRTGRG